jgi:hypothetical protein
MLVMLARRIPIEEYKFEVIRGLAKLILSVQYGLILHAVEARKPAAQSKVAS